MSVTTDFDDSSAYSDRSDSSWGGPIPRIELRPAVDEGIGPKRFPAGSPAYEQFWKGLPLWNDLTDILNDTDDNRIHARLVPYLQHIATGNHGKDPRDYDIPDTMLRRYGELTYRMLRRVWDLHLAYTDTPQFASGAALNGGNDLVRMLTQIALRHTHIFTFKKQILQAAGEWEKQIDRLADWWTFWKHVSGKDMPIGTYETRFNPVPEWFCPTVRSSERNDRMQVRRQQEDCLVNSINRAIEDTESTELAAPPPGAPEEGTLSWTHCLNTIGRFHALGGHQVSIASDIGVSMQAELLWRLTFLLLREYKGLFHWELVEIYCAELLAARELQTGVTLSSSGR